MFKNQTRYRRVEDAVAEGKTFRRASYVAVAIGSRCGYANLCPRGVNSQNVRVLRR
ncbi:uncharacterized protein METZ01_LOCUS38374 [marine metagenome]|uniref:Uncharacterized protein n=1 Tax=marine metagenome TaxID=408172 RepID=A0A381R209_9ZZZZ